MRAGGSGLVADPLPLCYVSAASDQVPLLGCNSPWTAPIPPDKGASMGSLTHVFWAGCPVPVQLS